MTSDILKPKSIEGIIESLDNETTKNTNYHLIQMIGSYDKHKYLLNPIVSSPSFRSYTVLEQMMKACCEFNVEKLAQIIIDKNILHLEENNNRFLRIAYHHNSVELIRILLKQNNVYCNLSDIQKHALRGYLVLDKTVGPLDTFREFL